MTRPISARASIGPTRPRGRIRTGLLTDLSLVTVDALLVVAAYAGALVIRFEGRPPADYVRGLVVFCAVAIVVHVASHAISGLYGQVWSYASAREARALVIAAAASSGLLFALVLLAPGERILPLSVPIIGGALALPLLGAARFQSRLFVRTEPAFEDHDTRVVVVGDVESAKSVIAMMQSDPRRGLSPVAVVAHDPANWGRALSGVPVIGPLDRLPDVVRHFRADQALLAFGSGQQAQVREAADLARHIGITAKVFPSVGEVIGRTPTLRDVRDLSIEDLLGRAEVRTDLGRIRRLLHGSTVLVTGAGGSIGSEIALQVSACDPALLVLLDHDETHLHDVGLGLGDGAIAMVLGDIRDPHLLHRVFTTHRPDIVFHAAAHKHVPILERFPDEAVRTNVFGTDNLLQAAVRHGVPRFVAISTDKAVNPSSVMGASKRVGEQLLLSQRPPDGHYCAVRFGNVLGSRGSVVPTFVKQIRAGGPVTITHPDMTRFFMSTREAVQLVLQAAALTTGGEIFMLDMGEPVRIVELAQRMIALSDAGRHNGIAIEFVGVRPGEKLVEELRSADEAEEPTSHPRIRLVRTPTPTHEQLAAHLARLHELVARHDDHAIAEALRAMAAGTGPDGTPGPHVIRLPETREAAL